MAKDGIDANTIAEAKEEAVDSYSAKNIETEKLSDGWLLTFENKAPTSSNNAISPMTRSSTSCAAYQLAFGSVVKGPEM